MRRASATIGTWLVLGAATAFVNCGGDDSTSPAGTGGSGGSAATGGSGGATGGTGGSGGSTSGAGGSGMQDSGADQSSGGSAGSAGKAGAGGAAGKAGGSGAGGDAGKAGAAGNAGAAGGGKAGASGAGGSAGSAGSGTGGSAGSSMDASADANQCPAMQPPNGSGPCDVEVDCVYGPSRCICRDPGPAGDWVCTGAPGDGGGAGDGGGCPAEKPTGLACPDAGLPIGPCFYDGNITCRCDVGDTDWNCILLTPAR
jgi:hypothetical protein